MHVIITKVITNRVVKDYIRQANWENKKIFNPKEGKKGEIKECGTGETQRKQIVNYFIIYYRISTY